MRLVPHLRPFVSSSHRHHVQIQNGVYDPTQYPRATAFGINSLQGNVGGGLFGMEIGRYSIQYQALGVCLVSCHLPFDVILTFVCLFVAAALTVTSESLTYDFNGTLRLALPLNSIISTIILAVTNSNPNGVSFSSNLFSITPLLPGSSVHLSSLILQRSSSDRLPCLLGVDHHPSRIVLDPSKVEYSTLWNNRGGTMIWKTDIQAITICVNSVPRLISLPIGIKSTTYLVAVLDSTALFIITTSEVVNGIYGALGIRPAADGQCKWSFIFHYGLSNVL